MADFKKEVEAILFAAGRVVTMKELQKLLHLNDPGLLKETIRELKEEYDSKESPLMIIAEGEGDEISGWKLTVREKMLPLVHKINPHTELSKSILETLAVITWKQPIVQSDVIRIRTNKAYEHIAELERMGFIAKKRFGRSYSISVTQKFLDYFDLKDNKEIKALFKDFKDVEVAVKNKKEELEKATPEVNPAEGEEVEGVEASADATEEGVDPEEGVELEPYIDVLPEATKPKRDDELEVYERDEEDIARDMMDDDLAEREPEGEEGEAEQGEETPEEETPEEKARRMARELVADEEEAEKEEEEREERELHPQLEEFIASSEEHNKPKGSEDHSDEIEEKEEEEGDEGEAASGEGEAEGKGPEEHEGSDEDHEKPAEEFPGQFDSEDQKHEGSEGSEESESSDDEAKQ